MAVGDREGLWAVGSGLWAFLWMRRRAIGDGVGGERAYAPRMGNHRELQVWQRAQRFAARIDRETRHLGRGHGELADQLRRASLSIPTNLAEGSSRQRDAEYLRFIGIAIGSAAEADSLLAHAESVDAFDRDVSRELADELTVIRKMLFKLRRALGGRTAVRTLDADSPPAV